MGKYPNLLKGAAAAFALAGMAFVATSASADLKPEFVTTTGAGPFTWSYNLTLSSAESVHNGDFVELYDFAGYTGTFTTTAGWTLTSTGFGPLPLVPAAGTDNPGLSNLILTWNGATINGPLAGQPVSIVGGFTAQSIYGQIASGVYEGSTHDNFIVTGTNGADQVQGNTFVPLNNTPEAGSLALLLPGLIPVGMAFRRRLKRA